MAEHFVQPPNWGWYILGYFFLAGITGGSYALATMLRIWGGPRDQATARIGFVIAFPLAVLCGILLTIDLGQPLRFFHMLVNTTPGATGLSLKYWSPISLGSWALLLYSVFAFVSFLDATGFIRELSGAIGRGFMLIGSGLALFIASYTGVVLAVSNQPVWSDTWTLGGLFLASALSGSAALLAWYAHTRTDAPNTGERLERADGYFALLELVLIVLFFVTLAAAGTLAKTFTGVYAVVWVLVLLSLAPPLLELARRRAAVSSTVAAVVVLAGVLLMRMAVIFSAQT